MRRNLERWSWSRISSWRRRLPMLRRRDNKRKLWLEREQRSLNRYRKKKLHRSWKLRVRNKNSWLLKLFKRPKPPPLKKQLLKLTLLEWRESTNFKEERPKPNYKCSKSNNKWKPKLPLKLRNQNHLKKFKKKKMKRKKPNLLLRIKLKLRANRKLTKSWRKKINRKQKLQKKLKPRQKLKTKQRKNLRKKLKKRKNRRKPPLKKPSKNKPKRKLPNNKPIKKKKTKLKKKNMI